MFFVNFVKKLPFIIKLSSLFLWSLIWRNSFWSRCYYSLFYSKGDLLENGVGKCLHTPLSLTWTLAATNITKCASIILFMSAEYTPWYFLIEVTLQFLRVYFAYVISPSHSPLSHTHSTLLIPYRQAWRRAFVISPSHSPLSHTHSTALSPYRQGKGGLSTFIIQWGVNMVHYVERPGGHYGLWRGLIHESHNLTHVG